MTPNDHHKLLTVREVAECVRVTERSVLRELRRGRLTGLRFGRQWRVAEQELFAYMRRHADESLAEIEPQRKNSQHE